MCALKNARDRAQFRDGSAFSAPRPARENSLLSSRCPEILIETVILLDADPAVRIFRISTPALPVSPCVSPLTRENTDYEGSHGIFRPCTPDDSGFLALMRFSLDGSSLVRDLPDARLLRWLTGVSSSCRAVLAGILPPRRFFRWWKAVVD